MIRDPRARLNVKPHQIRVHFLLLRDEAGHQRRPELPAEYANAVDECGERQHTVGLLSAGLAARSSGAAAAAGRAVGLVAGSVRLQAYSLTFIDAFHLIAWVSVATLILIATLRRFPMNFRDLAALDAGARPVRTSDQS